jgi:signal transduction histidine kinase
VEFVFFIYGLAFFLPGFAILYYPKKGSDFQLARKINYVAWFGVIHGINEWIDLFILIQALDVTPLLQYIRMVTLPLSFMFLVYFGAEVISSQKKNCRICKLLSPVLLVVWAVVFLLCDHNNLMWDITSRYLLCTVGAFVTGLALVMHVPEVKSAKKFKLAINLKIAGIAFMAYAFFAGLIVPDADFGPASFLNYSLFSENFGIPVQVFRSVCAVVIAYNIIRVLGIFRWEVEQAIFNSEMRFRTVVGTAPVILFIENKDQEIIFIKGRGLANLNITPLDVMFKPIDQVFVGVPQMYENSRKALSGQEVTSTLSLGDCHYEIFFGPFKNDEGDIDGVIGVAVDVTQQKNARDELGRYRTEMEKNRALATLGTVSMKIASEIAEPLDVSRILLSRALSGLRKTIGAEEVKGNISGGISKVSEAIKILDDFYEQADMKPARHAEPIELVRIVERIVSVFHENAQIAMLRIMSEGVDIVPAMFIKVRELEQIFFIVVQNAIQAADGVHYRELKIECAIKDDKLKLRFSGTINDGSVEGGKNIFSIDTDNSRGESGDFGLSILKGIVAAYEGTMAVTTSDETGTCIEVALPVFI